MKHSEARFSHSICPECAARNAERLERLLEKKNGGKD